VVKNCSDGESDEHIDLNSTKTVLVPNCALHKPLAENVTSPEQKEFPKEVMRVTGC